MQVFNPDFSRSIQLSDGSKLGLMPKDKHIFLDRSAVYYGATGTGKSYLVREELFLIKDDVERACLFSPTNDVNGDYDGIVHPAVIHRKVAKQAIEKLFTEQQRRARLHTIVHSLEYIKPIFHMCKNIPECYHDYYRILRLTEDIARSAQTRIEILTRNSGVTFDERESQKKSIEEQCKTAVIDRYRELIIKFAPVLEQCQQIKENKALLTVVRFININPRTVVIFDDCISELNSIMGKNKDGTQSVLSDMFTRGRWAYMTIIITTQDDTLIHTLIRKNSYVSLFTDPECAQHFMENKANSIIKEKRARANQAITAVFGGLAHENHKKLMYYRGGSAENWFTYTIAQTYGAFRIGSPAFWIICEKASQSQQDDQDEFLASF